MTDEQADRVVSGFVPESRYLYTDPGDGIIPKMQTRYIQTSSDESIRPDQQATMATTLGTDDITTLDTGHLPMLSRPDDLASVLDEFRAELE